MNAETLITGTLIEWQSVEPYITARGRRKLALEGIPTEQFWKAWKREKAAIKATGVCLSYEVEQVPAGRVTKTGMTSRAGGFAQGTRAKKVWTARLFVNAANRSTIAERWEMPGEMPLCREMPGDAMPCQDETEVPF